MRPAGIFMRPMDNFVTMTATSPMLGAKLRHFRDKKNYSQEYRPSGSA